MFLQRVASEQEGLFQGTRAKACQRLQDLCLLPVRRWELEPLYMLTWAPLCDTQVTPGTMVYAETAHLAQVFSCGLPGESPGGALSYNPTILHSGETKHSDGTSLLTGCAVLE